MYPHVAVTIADDSSPDGTAEVVKKFSNHYPNLSLMTRPQKMGLATAYTQTFQKLLKENPDIRSVVTMDAELSHDPAVIATMHNELGAYDLVIGSRYIPGGGIKAWSCYRRLLSWSGNLYAKLVTGLPIHDLTAGFHCFRTELLRKYNFSAIRSTGYAFQMEMKYIAWRLGGRIKEIPITFTDRSEGKSKLSSRIISEGIVAPWYIRFPRWS